VKSDLLPRRASLVDRGSIDSRGAEVRSELLRQVDPVAVNAVAVTIDEERRGRWERCASDCGAVCEPRAKSRCDARRERPRSGVVGLVLVQIHGADVEVDVPHVQGRGFT
jgi:hypothetical protein